MDCLKETKNGCILSVFVSSQKPKFRVCGFDAWKNAVKIDVSQKALDGKANKEMIGGLEDFFGKPASIVGGEKSRKKKIFIALQKEKVLERLKKAEN